MKQIVSKFGALSDPLRFLGMLIGLFLILSLVAVVYFSSIGSDPPYWMDETLMVDLGWWAGGARGRVLFGDFFSIDFGNTYLLLPAYTWALTAIYSFWGVGLPQTLILSAICHFSIVLILAVLLWKAVGRTEAILASVLLGISPFFWAHGRIGLPESMQSLFIVGSFVLLFLARRSKSAALGSGMAMAAAFAVKPNAVQLGFFPVMLAGVALYFFERWKKRAKLEHQTSARLTLSGVVLALLGFFLGLGLLFVLHVLPNWEAYWSTLLVNTPRNYRFEWSQQLTSLGYSMISKLIVDDGFQPIVWRVAKWSPVIMTGSWLYILGLLFRFRLGFKQGLQSLSPLEIATVVWVLGTMSLIWGTPYQPDYRYITLVPGLAVLSGLFFARSIRNTSNTFQVDFFLPFRNSKRMFSFWLWAVLLIPLMLVIKPWVSRILMDIGQNIPLGRHQGIGLGSAGTFFMVFWFFMLWALANVRLRPGKGKGTSFNPNLPPRRLGLLVLLALLSIESWAIAHHFVNAQTTLLDRQVELSEYLEKDAVVVGRMAGTLFLPSDVRTVRRLQPQTVPLEISENPTRLDLNSEHPSSYVILTSWLNYRLYVPYKSILEDLLRKGYRSVYRFDVGPFRSGIPRYEFELFRRVAWDSSNTKTLIMHAEQRHWGCSAAIRKK
jgi:4-amino-4-deoxy-L-arabinose transferase-like glycosyltransferase